MYMYSPMKLNVQEEPIPNVCYAVNACGRVSRTGQWELDLGVSAAHIHVHKCIHKHTHTHACTKYSFVQISHGLQFQLHTNIQTHTHARAHTHTHTHTYTHKHKVQLCTNQTWSAVSAAHIHTKSSFVFAPPQFVALLVLFLSDDQSRDDE